MTGQRLLMIPQAQHHEHCSSAMAPGFLERYPAGLEWFLPDSRDVDVGIGKETMYVIQMWGIEYSDEVTL